MSDDAFDVVTIPAGTKVIQPTSIDFIYERPNDADVICLLIGTSDGPLLIPFTPNQADYISANLRGLVSSLDTLRLEHQFHSVTEEDTSNE